MRRHRKGVTGDRPPVRMRTGSFDVFGLTLFLICFFFTVPYGWDDASGLFLGYVRLISLIFFGTWMIRHCWLAERA